ncbi:MAG: TetR family transcriptional regulator [Chloroflexota bacterium]
MTQPARSQPTRRALLEAGRRTLTANPAAALADVAAEAGVSRATVYRYFDSRAALRVDELVAIHDVSLVD